MSFKHFLITEAEKKNIKAMYGLITEAVDPAPITTTVTFAGGRYLQQSANFSQVVENFQKIKDFIKSVPTGKIVEVVIEAGESQIPNTDNENGGTRVNPGILSTKRYDTISTYLTKQFTKWKDADPAFKKPEKFTKIPAKIGATPWMSNNQVSVPFCPKEKIPADDKQGYVCTDDKFVPAPVVLNWQQGKDSVYKAWFDKYQKQQYVKVTFKVGEGSAPNVPTSMVPRVACLKGMKIELNYDAVVEKSVDGGGLSNVHCCSRGEFAITANNIRLSRSDKKSVNANINNHPDEITQQNPQTDGRRQGQSSTGLKKTKKFPNGEGVCLPPNLKKGTVVDTDFKLEGLDNYRYNTFTIDGVMADKIVKDSNGQPGVLNIGVSAVDSSQHSSAARLLIYSPEGKLYWDSCSGNVCQRKPVYQVPYCIGKSF
jgi:hypothetical protein